MRRRPKTLDREPLVFTPTGGGKVGEVLVAAAGMNARPIGGGSSAPAITGEDGEAIGLDQLESEADPETLRRAREIAAALALRRSPPRTHSQRGLGEIVSLPFASSAAEIDIEATIERLVGQTIVDAGDIIVRERVHRRRPVALVVDLSGSMRGERVRSAAAAVGALCGELANETLAVIAFWSDAAILLPVGAPVAANRILDLLARIPARGLTNVELPLRLAREQLERVRAADARVLLLSDCVHNAGPDPRTVAATLPRLDVLLDIAGEKDLELGRRLARLGRGRLETVRDYRDIGPALSRIL